VVNIAKVVGATSSEGFSRCHNSPQLKIEIRFMKYINTTMWANAQRDGRPAEYRWRPLVNAAKFG